MTLPPAVREALVRAALAATTQAKLRLAEIELRLLEALFARPRRRD